ncbi:MAG: dTMP kinase [Spirochaetales bacterium]|uniref:Thymidylate kinase n=1 Tax=Candidatus Thalassospirochaeta sargassi TaxID=3119039 RepID=A0AAJ1MLQ2_9SPIO|nr:dTMP kinase [Spirochaetales bacterium]
MNEKRKILKDFIVLEGLDGSGTTTQLKLLTEALLSHGSSVFSTCEPSPLPTGKIIRQVLEKEISVEAETLARMFSADRYEHLYGKSDGIIKHLKDGDVVITDRYLFSSLAYQSLGCDFDFVKQLNPYPLPEYLVYVDVTPETCRERMTGRELEELFDGDDIQMRIVSNYERGMAAFPESGMKLLRIDGHQGPDEICSEILAGIGR